MSFINLSNELFETTTFNIKPQIHFISSSKGEFPASGSAYVAPIRSKCIRNLASENVTTINLQESGIPFSEGDFKSLTVLKAAKIKTIMSASIYSGSGLDISGYMSDYLNISNDAPKDIRFSKFLDVFRFDPPLKFNLNHVVKRNINNVLNPYHKHRYPDSGIHYTNYNCLNFFTSSNTPNDACLVYPNQNDNYTPEKGFTLDFWINPRYDNFTSGSAFNCGTIFHMSSSIAVSLVSGSVVDEKHLTSNYKLLLQLSSSADINPRSIDLDDINAKSDLIFSSSFDLKKNNWHHISILWDPNHNNSSGSIRIDENIEEFYVPSSSLTTTNEIITLGNYFNSTSSDAKKLFNATKSTNQGLTQLVGTTLDPANQSAMFSNPLNAEIYDVKLFNKALNKFEIDKLSIEGVNQKIVTKNGCEVSETSLYDNLLFYVPVFFYPKTRTREVIVTPFQTINTTTDDPINVSYSFGVGGKLINLENFTKEFIKGEFPRLQSLTGSVIETTVQDITADSFVYNTGSLTQRNLTILPCDNGLFNPDYYVLSISEMSASEKYVKSGDSYDYSKISLNNLIPSSSLFPGLVFQSGSIFDQIVGASPENPGVAPGSVLTIAQRTRDRSSNESVIFDISNLYYGNKISESTFEVIDDHLTGSKGHIKIKIKDNGAGSLYRADCLTKQATWNNVGDIFYHEGMIVLKTPHLPYFAKDKTDIKFKGDQNIHTMILNIPCEQGQFNSSSNKTYVANPPTNTVSDQDLSTVYVSTVNIHDNNFNIIMKANFSQPIPKTEEDEFIIRLKQDF